ncbi:MAG: TIM-barrel domain-containing protein, partial [Planctomycetota bacterium]
MTRTGSSTLRVGSRGSMLAIVVLAGTAVSSAFASGAGTGTRETASARYASPEYAPTEIIAERLGAGIVRFNADAAAQDDRLPSFALERPLQGKGRAAPDFGPSPVFSVDADGKFVTEMLIEDGTSLYGTGQVAGPLLRNGRVIEAWNTDAYKYPVDNPPMYTSHPWVLGVRADGTAFGVLADTTYRVEIDLSDGIAFRADGRAHPVIVVDGDSPQEVMVALGDLTGTIEMPPRWAVGYHQCRYSYFPDSRVREIATEFRDRSLPADVIWMDIDYMDGFRCFMFDEELFPDPAGLNGWLDDSGFANVWMINPGIKNEDGYFVHDQGDELNAWVQRADGTEYTGEVWPGEVVFPDYTIADVRAWWAGLYGPYMELGIDGVWNDMNEPSVFNEPTKTMPESNIHRGDSELGGTLSHARYHNVYGMLMVKASREGIMDANPGKRPFVLSRANYIGGHRYGATWTGDNTANWLHVDLSISMTLNLGLSGQPFVGPDIGGFIGETSPELFSRWIGLGTLLPFSRGHTEKGTGDKEPWAFGPEVEATSRRALERRYRLMPLFYSLFEESHRNGMPVARPLFFADPVDPDLRDADDAFMLGENLIVAAQVTENYTTPVVLPENNDWHEFDFPSFDGGRDSKDQDQPRLFLREGGIVPAGPVHQHFGDRPDQRDELHLLIALDDSGVARGELYEDAGEGWGFRDGAYLRSRYTAVLRDGEVVVNGRT